MQETYKAIIKLMNSIKQITFKISYYESIGILGFINLQYTIFNVIQIGIIQQVYLA